jgi:hypothetical protein
VEGATAAAARAAADLETAGKSHQARIAELQVRATDVMSDTVSLRNTKGFNSVREVSKGFNSVR